MMYKIKMNNLDFIKIKNPALQKTLLKTKDKSGENIVHICLKVKRLCGEQMEKLELSCTAGGNVK